MDSPTNNILVKSTSFLKAYGFPDTLISRFSLARLSSYSKRDRPRVRLRIRLAIRQTVHDSDRVVAVNLQSSIAAP